jgi:hypothetical protein
MRHFVLAAVLAAFTSAAEAQLRPSDPQGGIPVSSLEPAPLSAGHDVSIATDGSRYFAAWSGGWTNNRDIVGTRLSPEGAVLDREGIPIAPTYEPDTDPVVVWDGEDWLVFHSAGRLGGRVVKVSESGNVVTGRSTERTRITGAVRVGGRVHLAFHRFGLSWEPAVSWGVVGEDLGIAEEIPLDTGRAGDPRIATDGSASLVVWESFDEPDTVLHAALIGPDGMVVDRLEVARVAYQSPAGQWFPTLYPDVAWDGSSWIVVWRESGIRRVEIDRYSGEVSEPLLLENDTGAARPTIAAHGGEAIVVYAKPRHDLAYSYDMVGVRLVGGMVVDRFPIASSFINRAAIATNGSNFVVIAGGMARVIDTSTAPVILSEPSPLTWGFRSENLPEVIGEETLLLTLQDAGRVRAWRFSRDGIRLDPPDRPIVIEGPDFHVSAASESAFLIAWAAAGGRFVGQRISYGGVVIDDQPFVIASSDEDQTCHLAAASSDGADFLVVFTCRGHSITAPYLLRAAVVSSAGEADPPGPVLVPHEFSQTDPAVTWTGSRYQIAWKQQVTPWQRFRRDPPTEFELWTMQLARDGLVIEGTRRTVGARTTAGALTEPAVAFSGESVLVAGGAGAAVLTPEGAVVRKIGFDDPVPSPQAIWTGRDYLVWSPGGRRVIRIDPAQEGVARSVEYFDPEGSPAIGGIGVLSGGRLLLTYTIRWIPFPHAHEAFLTRAYYQLSGGDRRRAVRR